MHKGGEETKEEKRKKGRRSGGVKRLAPRQKVPDKPPGHLAPSSCFSLGPVAEEGDQAGWGTAAWKGWERNIL